MMLARAHNRDTVPLNLNAGGTESQFYAMFDIVMKQCLEYFDKISYTK